MRLVQHARVLLLALLLAVGTLVPAISAFAQTAAPPTEREALAELVQTIEDPVRREALLAQLRALLQASEAMPGEAVAPPLSEKLVEAAREAGAAVREGVEAVADQVGAMPEILAWLRRIVGEPERRAGAVRLAGTLLGILLAGLLAELAIRLALSRALSTIDRQRPEALLAKLPLSGARAMLDSLPIAGFAGAAVAATAALDPPALVRGVALQLVTAYVLSRIVLLLGRWILAPRTPHLRLLPLTDATAARLARSLRTFVNTAVIALMLIEVARLLGLSEVAAMSLRRLLGALLLLMWTVYVLRHRAAVARWLHERRTRLGATSPRLEALLGAIAASWHVVAIAYAVGFFVVSAFAIEGGFALMAQGTAGTALALALAWWLIGWLQRLRRSVDERPRRAGPIARLPRYAAIGLGVAQLAVVGVALAVILLAWGVDVRAVLAGALAQRVAALLLTTAVVLALAVVAWEIADTAIERYLRGVTGDGIRARTLLPLLRKALLVVLTVVVLLTLLSELGIQIAPLLAGAGVVGLAVGFGAQRLVQDVITGFFILVEDSIAAGDVVSVAGMSGVVEDLSIRSIRLRDIAGTVHTVPFSSVGTVSNMTRGFSYFVADIGVGYGEDVDRVAEVCTAIVEEMRADDRFRRDILEPLEVLGLDRFADSAVIIKARIKTRPSRQWSVGREFNRRMKKRFDELGIEIPFPQRTVHLAGGSVARRPTEAEAVAALGA
jgi:small conductance mechanosensitive channel